MVALTSVSYFVTAVHLNREEDQKQKLGVQLMASLYHKL